MARTVNTVRNTINNEIAQAKADTRAQINKLSGEFADATMNWVSTLAANVQRQVGFFNALGEIEFDFATIDDAEDSVEVAALRKLSVLADMQGNTALNGRRDGQEVVEGRVAAAKFATRVVADATRDHFRATAKAAG